MYKDYVLTGSPFFRFLSSNTTIAPLWLIVRLYVGWEWLVAGWGKVTNPAWFGTDAGPAITGFVGAALKKTAEFCPPEKACHPDVQGWYAAFLENFVLPFPEFWSNLVAGGEVLVGVALMLGVVTGIAAFFGAFMNLNFMLAGTVSINPILFTLGIGLMFAWKVAGHIGLDRWVLPSLERYFKK